MYCVECRKITFYLKPRKKSNIYIYFLFCILSKTKPRMKVCIACRMLRPDWWLQFSIC